MSEGDFAPRPWKPTAEYYIAGGHDVRDVIEAFGLNYNRGAVVKYIARAGRKPGNGVLLDLLKAREHINREIACLTKEGVPPPPSDPVRTHRRMTLDGETFILIPAEDPLRETHRVGEHSSTHPGNGVERPEAVPPPPGWGNRGIEAEPVAGQG